MLEICLPRSASGDAIFGGVGVWGMGVWREVEGIVGGRGGMCDVVVWGVEG